MFTRRQGHTAQVVINAQRFNCASVHISAPARIMILAQDENGRSGGFGAYSNSIWLVARNQRFAGRALSNFLPKRCFEQCSCRRIPLRSVSELSVTNYIKHGSLVK